MKIRALAISIGDLAVGTLFQYGDFDNAPITRFVADDDFIRMQDPPLLSLSMLADDPQAQRALWVNIGSPAFNGRSSARNGLLALTYHTTKAASTTTNAARATHPAGVGRKRSSRA